MSNPLLKYTKTELAHLIASQWHNWCDYHDITPEFVTILPDSMHQGVMLNCDRSLYTARTAAYGHESITQVYIIQPENVHKVILWLDPKFPEEKIAEPRANVRYGETPVKTKKPPKPEEAVTAEIGEPVKEAEKKVAETKEKIANVAIGIKEAEAKVASTHKAVIEATPSPKPGMRAKTAKKANTRFAEAKHASELAIKELNERRAEEAKLTQEVKRAEEDLARLAKIADDTKKERELAEKKARDAAAIASAVGMKEMSEYATPEKELPVTPLESRRTMTAMPDPTVYAREHKDAEIIRVARKIDTNSGAICSWILGRIEYFREFQGKIPSLQKEQIRGLALLCCADDIICAIDNESLPEHILNELIMRRIIVQYATSNHPELSKVSAIIREFNAEEFEICIARVKSVEPIECDELSPGPAPTEPAAAREVRAREDMTELQVRSKCFRYGKCVLAKDANEYFKSITSQWPMRNQQEFEEDVKKARKDATELLTRSETVDIYVDGAPLQAFIARYC